MRYLIITVAGTASRFNRDTQHEILKCLYYEGAPKFSLLAQLIKNCGDYDKYIIVGGYLYGNLQKFVTEHLTDYSDKIVLVENKQFKELGSGYSLYKGIMAIEEPGEVTFVEGDLFFKEDEFRKVYNCEKSVLSINHEPIYAKKAVALYLDKGNRPHYLYDIQHDLLSISEPFTAIFNSGQIWKFHSYSKLMEAINSLSDVQLSGTNLEIVQAYFNRLTPEDYEVVDFSTWYNCNTVADYKEVRNKM